MWNYNNGYCGECSIQQIALYYGTYVSQYRAREIIDPTQHQDALLPENAGPILDALRLNYVAWDSDHEATPQYQDYLVWVKSQLQQKLPVIMDVFDHSESGLVNTNDYDDYDHIVPVTGFTSVDTNRYHADDVLVFNDDYSKKPCTRTFATLDDTRAMKGKGASNEICLPRETDYGWAVTGIKDGSGTALPVSLKVDLWKEPKRARGQAAVPVSATIRVSD